MRVVLRAARGDFEVDYCGASIRPPRFRARESYWSKLRSIIRYGLNTLQRRINKTGASVARYKYRKEDKPRERVTKRDCNNEVF